MYALDVRYRFPRPISIGCISGGVGGVGDETRTGILSTQRPGTWRIADHDAHQHDIIPSYIRCTQVASLNSMFHDPVDRTAVHAFSIVLWHLLSIAGSRKQ